MEGGCIMNRKHSMSQNSLSVKMNRSLNAFIIPSFAVLLCLTVVPLFFSLIISFFNYKLIQPDNIRFCGIDNFIRAFGDRQFVSSIKVTVIQVVATVAGQMVLGIFAALLFSREGFIVRILRAIYIIPMMITPVVTGIMFRMMFNTDLGFVNYLLSVFGISPVNWLGDSKMALVTVILTDIWLSTPFVTMILLAGIQSIEQDYYSAASIDGCNFVQKFFHITLPLIRPMILLALLFRLMDAIRRYDSIMAMTNGGPGTATQTLNIYSYYQGFSFLNIGYSSALSLMMLIVIVCLSIFLLNKINKEN